MTLGKEKNEKIDFQKETKNFLSVLKAMKRKIGRASLGASGAGLKDLPSCEEIEKLSIGIDEALRHYRHRLHQQLSLRDRNRI